MNKKAENIEEYEKKKKEIAHYLLQQIGVSSEILGRIYHVFVDVKAEINIIPLGDQ